MTSMGLFLGTKLSFIIPIIGNYIKDKLCRHGDESLIKS